MWRCAAGAGGAGGACADGAGAGGACAGAGAGAGGGGDGGDVDTGDVNGDAANGGDGGGADVGAGAGPGAGGGGGGGDVQRLAAPGVYVNLIGFSFDSEFYRGFFDKVKELQYIQATCVFRNYLSWIAVRNRDAGSSLQLFLEEIVQSTLIFTLVCRSLLDVVEILIEA